MEELLSVGERKELELFRFVLNSDGFVSTTRLSKLINSSVSNVWRIINKLAETYPQYILLVKNKHLGIQFVELESTQDAYLFIKCDYLKNNLNYIFLDSLFNENHSSVQEFCDTHFISTATFYTKKKELDALLDANKVTIDTKHFCIRSFNDMYVREFYYHFYWEAFKTITWPFKTLDKKVIEAILEPFLSSANITLSNVEREQILYRLATTTIRIKKHHIFDRQILHNLISPELKTLLFTQTSWLKDLMLNEEEYVHENDYLAFLVISNYSSAYVNLPIPNDYLVNYFESIDSTEWSITINFFIQLKVIFPDQTFDPEKNLSDLLHMMYTHIYSSFFSNSYVPSLITQDMKNISPLCLEAGQKIIATIDTTLPPQNIDYLNYYYSLFIEHYFEFKKVRISLHLSSDRMSVDRLKNRLLNVFKEHITFIDIPEQNDVMTDLIISDTHFNTSSEVFFSRQPNSEQSFNLLKDSVMALFFKLNQ